MSDIKYLTIEVVNGRIGPHLTEFGESRRVSLVGVVDDSDGLPAEVVYITGIVDIRHESVHDMDELDEDTMLDPSDYDGERKDHASS